MDPGGQAELLWAADTSVRFGSGRGGGSAWEQPAPSREVQRAEPRRMAFLLAACEGLDSGFVPSVQDFDKKLTEADAYLQILIEQPKLFDDKLQNCKDDEQRKKIETLKETTNSSTINPVDAIYQPSPLEPVISTMPSQTVLPPEHAQLCKSQQRPSSLPVAPVLATLGHHQTPAAHSTGSGHSPPSSSLTSPSHVTLSPNTVPEFSYSSSEDEFYDTDEFHQSSSSPKRLVDSCGSASVLTHSSLGNSLKCPDTTESLNSSMSNGTSDADLFDSHDDRDDDGEVNLGMDLTKVVLPTFILERRSLLEMYADFFAHPDLFVSISDQKDPRDQMVQVMKWYLSERISCQKPYNPILGEIFQFSEGPVPWVSKNSVTFMTEQVSRHLPISAFYAECFNKNIQFNAHIWTKSKFLGMSVGVHSIGQGCVLCLDYYEHYILTFPNGYRRSLLTMPWVELGGECSINCSETGCSANIVFHTEPFCGGKKHRITNTFCSIEGGVEWYNICKIHNRGKYSLRRQKLPIIKKKGRKLEDQNEYESYCLWKDVTFNLKIRDIDAATEAKHRLEERQRAGARERKEKEIQWETRLFHKDEECWVSDEPLLKCLGAAKH
uniref:Oxysterol-binding protein n=1 Tax=Chinchilla lanigera TaxID=34839 RepID=A0A8C2V9N2_CHILA